MSIGTYPPQIGTVPVPIEQGGTNATTAAQARTNLALGTMAQQDANAVAITGGSATLVSVTSTSNFEALDSVGEFQTSFVGRKSAGTNRWNLYCDGTAVNYLAAALSIANPTPEANCRFSIRWRHADTSGIHLRVSDSDTGAFGALIFQNLAGTVIGSVTTTAAATAYNTSSDVRLKHAIAPLTDSIDVVRRLRPISHLWRADDSPGVGFLAHEVADVVGGVVTGKLDAVDEEGNIVPQMIDHSKLVPYLTAALKDALAMIDTLSQRVQALEAAS